MFDAVVAAWAGADVAVEPNAVVFLAGTAAFPSGTVAVAPDTGNEVLFGAVAVAEVPVIVTPTGDLLDVAVISGCTVTVPACASVAAVTGTGDIFVVAVDFAVSAFLGGSATTCSGSGICFFFDTFSALGTIGTGKDEEA